MKETNHWLPERFFYSHASNDISLTQIIEKEIKNLGFDIYIAERNLVGIPLIEKLREELINSNALLLGWTKNTSLERSSPIISFEIGMAYSLGLPIYILKTFGKMPWFYDKLTDYLELNELTEISIREALKKIQLFSFLHPIDLTIPKEELFKYGDKNQSQNIIIVQSNGSLNVPANFNGIIHFNLTNRRPKSEKNVRLLIKFPKELTIDFDAGSLDGNSKVQRNEIFDMRETPRGTIRMYWASLPAECFNFEVRIKTGSQLPKTETEIECNCSSDNIIGWRKKVFKVTYT